MRKRLMIVCLVSLGLVAGCASNKNKKKDDMAAKKKKDKKMADEQAKKDEEAKAEREKLEARIEKLESQLEQARMLAKSRKQMQKDLENELASLVDAGKVKLTTRRGLLVVQIPREVLFESGKFELKDEGKKTLKSVASELGGLKKHRVLVAGHTDNVPVSKKSADFKNNWELSSKRALSATKVLAGAGVKENKLAAAGFGANDPVASNDSKEGRMKNRRVELMLVPNLSKVLKRAKAQAKKNQNDQE